MPVGSNAEAKEPEASRWQYLTAHNKIQDPFTALGSPSHRDNSNT